MRVASESGAENLGVGSRACAWRHMARAPAPGVRPCLRVPRRPCLAARSLPQAHPRPDASAATSRYLSCRRRRRAIRSCSWCACGTEESSPCFKFAGSLPFAEHMATFPFLQVPIAAVLVRWCVYSNTRRACFMGPSRSHPSSFEKPTTHPLIT